MQHERLGVCAAPGAERTRDRRRYAATDPAVGHHRHQHEERKDEGDAGDGAGPEEAHEIRLRDTDERLQRKHGENGAGEFEKRARYRPFEERGTSHKYASSSPRLTSSTMRRGGSSPANAMSL
jgi:hypothetical protein